jgi:hypothetical protein
MYKSLLIQPVFMEKTGFRNWLTALTESIVAPFFSSCVATIGMHDCMQAKLSLLHG